MEYEVVFLGFCLMFGLFFGRFFRGGGQGGFTLFTALIAFILIVLAMLLVQSMVSTERSTSEILNSIAEQQEMQAVADLARADALQVFNYSLRYAIEEHSTMDETPKDGLPENLFIVFPDDVKDWGSLKESFIVDRFGASPGGNNQLALLTARHLISLVERTSDARGFDIELDNPDESRMTMVLRSAFEKQISSDPNDFFEVINCEYSVPSDFKDCVGSFYITIDLSEDSMSDADYESFPQIRVENVLSKKVIKEPILPRGKFRIYVPVRLFKALAGAKIVADKVFDSGFIANLPSSRGDAEDYLKKEVEAIVGSGVLSSSDFEVYSKKPFEVLVTSVSDSSGVSVLDKFEVTLYFEEKNKKYMVSELGSHVYGVKLVKNLR